MISVVMPVFNARCTINESIQSVLAQEFVEFELIVIDDGSTDGSANVITEYVNMDDRVSCITQRNSGIASARNAGIARASGEFVATIDADDLWHSKKLFLQLEAIKEAGLEYGMVYSSCRTIDTNSNVLFTPYVYYSKGWCVSELAYYNFIRNGSSVLFRKSVADELGGFCTVLHEKDGQGCEDILFSIMVANGHAVTYTEGLLVGYRIGGDRVSTDLLRMQRSRDLAMAIATREVPNIDKDAVKFGNVLVYLRTVGRGYQRKVSLGTLCSVFTKALFLDPLGTLFHIFYGVKRVILENTAGRNSPKHFYDYDPFDLSQSEEVSWIIRRRLTRFSKSKI